MTDPSFGSAQPPPRIVDRAQQVGGIGALEDGSRLVCLRVELSTHELVVIGKRYDLPRTCPATERKRWELFRIVGYETRCSNAVLIHRRTSQT